MKQISIALLILAITTGVAMAQEKDATEAMILEQAMAQAQPAASAQQAEAPKPEVPISTEYIIGNDDVLDITVIQPEKMALMVTVSPDGNINFPYIGTVPVKGMTLEKVQNVIQARLADGYMKYPVVSVTLKECRSKKFFVYGEVARPGTYYLEDNSTILKAISLAGGFTKYGSSSRVKVLRPKKGEKGYDTIKVNINAVMDGSSKDDVVLETGDIVVISEGVF